MDRWVIVDIDGTVADLSHRRHYVAVNPKNWNAFNAGVSYDTPIWPVIDTVKALNSLGVDLVFVSGRSDDTKDATIRWLMEDAGFKFPELHMRKFGDYREDSIVKREIYQAIRRDRGVDPIAVFDDRPSVIKMWREIGLFVFNVDQGVWE